MEFVPEGQHDSSRARSAWRAPPQKIRPVGYGVILAGVRTNRSRTSLGPIIPYPTGRFFRGRFPRHFVPGYDRCVPTGRACKRFATASRERASNFVTPFVGPKKHPKLPLSSYHLAPVEWREHRPGSGRFIAPKWALGFSPGFQPGDRRHGGRSKVPEACQAHHFASKSKMNN